MPHPCDVSRLPRLPAAKLAAVLALAEQAGQAILQVYRSSDPGLRFKDDASPVTLADTRAHALIAQGLQALTPDIPVVSEEDPASLALRRSARVYWLVDPLDGTREFVDGLDEFTVNIALIVNAQVQWGVVHAPALGLTYWGGAGQGAWRRQALTITGAEAPAAALRCAGLAADGVLRVLASRSHLGAETEQWMARLGPHRLVQAGSSLKFCRIAEGQADVYPRLGPTCEWDTAAGQAVLEGAGGTVRVLPDGAPLRYGKTEVRNPHFVACSTAWWTSRGQQAANLTA